MGDKSSIDSSNLESAIQNLSIAQNKEATNLSKQLINTSTNNTNGEKSIITPEILNSVKTVMRHQLLNQMKGKVNINESKRYLEAYFEDNVSNVKYKDDLFKFKQGFVDYVKNRFLKQ